jgi:hypothetical protein
VAAAVIATLIDAVYIDLGWGTWLDFVFCFIASTLIILIGASLLRALLFLIGTLPRSVPAQREMENGRSPLVNIPPCGRGFSRHPGLPIRCDFGKSAKGDFRARPHRLDEPTRLSLGMVASPQSPLPFHLAEPL